MTEALGDLPDNSDSPVVLDGKVQPHQTAAMDNPIDLRHRFNADTFTG
ncbi:hypothetical protein PI124_g20296 [Phytophthora idaei]|nr:hypothetical protein PI125_g19335 [Phytophthora idaei]KAG3131758.1 hypothetical protein PI126_g19927 [Phytophthora idaei]KAG3234654.1 hypothetical protein PI124_g20296 [Phytophthora idaei]